MVAAAAQQQRCPLGCALRRPISTLGSRCSNALRWAGGNSPRHRRLKAPPGAAALRVVATSEFWYEDEEEFDALTDAMKPKTVVLVVAPAPGTGGDAARAAAGQAEAAPLLEALRVYLQPLTFNQAFASEQSLPFAQQLWAGRDRPPYFLKVRVRAALGAACCGGQADGALAAAAAAAAEGVWQELLQQNWRVELDAGLGGALPESEAVLLVCAPEAVEQLLATAGTPASSSSSAGVTPGAVFALQVAGTQAGDPLDWRQLRKQLVLAGAVPGGSSSGAAGDSIVADLEEAAARAQAVVH